MGTGFGNCRRVSWKASSPSGRRKLLKLDVIASKREEKKERERDG